MKVDPRDLVPCVSLLSKQYLVRTKMCIALAVKLTDCQRKFQKSIPYLWVRATTEICVEVTPRLMGEDLR